MPLNRRNHYRMLFVQPDAPQSVIKAAYRALAAEQQRVSGSVSALVTEAYTVLADAAARAAYDAQLGTQAVAHASNQPVAPLPGFEPTATVAPATVAPATVAPATVAPATAAPATAAPAAAPPAAPLLPPTPYPGTTVTRTPVAVPVAATAVPFPSTPFPSTPAKGAVAAQGAPASVPSAPFPATPSPATPRTSAVAAQVAAPTSPAVPFPSVPFPAPAGARTGTAQVGGRSKGTSASAVYVAPSAPAHAVVAAATVAVPTTACPMCQAPREGRISMDTRCHRCRAPLAPVPKAVRPRATAGNERRSLPRVGRSDWATMHAPWNAEPVRVRLRDLSADGISVYSSARVATGARIRIGNERFDLVATVVGCRAVRHVFSLHARLETAWVAPKKKQG